MDIQDIFPKEPPIELSDKFNGRLDERRAKYTADKGLLSKETVLIDIDNIKELPNGKIRIDIDGVRFECFFSEGNRKKMYVILNGARTIGERKTKIPMFNRWSYYAFCDYTWLSIEDPTYFDNDDVTVGWFYGTRDKNYREYVAYIASKICDFLKVNKDNVCFLGGSAGGTAAIHSAALFGYGVGISINGQINFEYDHKDITSYIENTGIDLHQKDRFHRNDICKIISENIDSKFLIIENCRSKWDVNDHLNYLCKKLNIKPNYGITRFNNLTTWIYDAPALYQRNPHVCFENKNIFYAIDFLAGLIRKEENIEKYKQLYLLFNEIWYDIYNPSVKLEQKNFHVQGSEYLTGEQIVDKLMWNRNEREKLSKQLEEIKAIINCKENNSSQQLEKIKTIIEDKEGEN